ncbi:hypothetical protein BT67DRAFT_301806 [Trichocladium antarcticum]|uniref:Uncharacterized protein n=1 Tax=Trichocladium antarcticum TaxID=1450529 RepID=A0AAN6ZEA5_9PEZI|nr:hypothetical protein BT67DRAFT_301806 [Trichocladium antarcticum]
MDALKHIVANVPDWLRRLDDLSGQIEQRQIDLAKLVEAVRTASPEGSSPPPRSLRNKGSTESLKARDEPEAHPRDPIPTETENVATTTVAAAAGAAAAAKATADQQTPPSPVDSHSPSALVRRTNQVRAAGQARARATLRKRQRTDSVLSAEGATPKYRTRSMIIVYYDSYVQMFFEELVKFVSSGRNMMRKAKMAARVAKIRLQAEMLADDDDDAAALTPGGLLAAADSLIGPSATPHYEAPPALQYTSTRRMAGGPRATSGMYMRAGGMRGARRGGVGPDGKPDLYDELDQGLEYVQSMCEHAAHQFLRDGECGEEVANIRRRMTETRDLADKEMERIKQEDPQALLSAGGDETRGRSYRPQSMRRDHHANKPAASLALELEVDERFKE